MESNPHPSFSGLLRSFEQFPDRIAITDKKGQSYSYAEFYERISWCKQELARRGVKKGTRVLVAVPMSMELYALMEALFATGAVIVFLDPWLKGKQMASIIRQVKPELMIATRKIRMFAYLMPATWSIPKKWTIGHIGRSKRDWSIEQVDDNDVALITFTGGTSGKPKGADRTFGFLNAQLNALESHMRSSTSRPFVDYTNFPIVGLADFAMGNHVVIPRINLMKIHEADADRVVYTLINSGVNRIITSPSLLKKVKEGLDKSENTGSIEHIITGGAPVPFSLVQAFLDDFPNMELEVIYGSTEAEPIALTSFETMRNKMDDPLKGTYAGVTVDEIEMKIIRPVDQPVKGTDFNDLELPKGKVGEIVVTGDHVNKSYFENPDAFKEVKVVDENGIIWHRTGDIGYLEDEGLYLVGRLHRIITVDGGSYHPYPIEFLMERELGVTDCGYIQMPDGTVTLFVGDAQPSTEKKIVETITGANHPIDRVKFYGKPLPRDPRHRSKLQTKPLLNG